MTTQAIILFRPLLLGLVFFFVWSFRVLCVSCVYHLCVLSCLVVCLVFSCLVLLSCLVLSCLVLLSFPVLAYVAPSAKHNPYLTRTLSIFDFPLTGLRLRLCHSPSPFVFLDCFFELRLICFICLKQVSKMKRIRGSSKKQLRMTRGEEEDGIQRDLGLCAGCVQLRTEVGMHVRVTFVGTLTLLTQISYRFFCLIKFNPP